MPIFVLHKSPLSIYLSDTTNKTLYSLLPHVLSWFPRILYRIYWWPFIRSTYLSSHFFWRRQPLMLFPWPCYSSVPFTFLVSHFSTISDAVIFYITIMLYEELSDIFAARTGHSVLPLPSPKSYKGIGTMAAFCLSIKLLQLCLKIQVPCELLLFHFSPFRCLSGKSPTLTWRSPGNYFCCLSNTGTYLLINIIKKNNIKGNFFLQICEYFEIAASKIRWTNYL